MVNELHCDTCDRDFIDVYAANQHRNAKGHWECEVCYKTFDGMLAAENHMGSTNHRQSRYCFDCSRGFPSEHNYNQHRNSRVHIGTQITCPLCKAAFVTASGLSHHIERGGCPKARGVNRKVVYTEIRRRDPTGSVTNKLLEWKNDPDVQTFNTANTWNGSGYECYICHREFNSTKAINQHLSSAAHAQNLYHCPKATCSRQFSSLAAFFNHLESESYGYVRFEQVQSNVGNFLNGGSSQRAIGFY